MVWLRLAIADVTAMPATCRCFVAFARPVSAYPLPASTSWTLPAPILSWLQGLVATEVEPLDNFSLAEDFHQHYLERGGRFGRAQSAEKQCTDPIRYRSPFQRDTRMFSFMANSSRHG